MPTDLQSAPFGRSGNLACTLKRCEWNATHYSVIYTNRQVERIFSYPDAPLSRAQPRAVLAPRLISPMELNPLPHALHGVASNVTQSILGRTVGKVSNDAVGLIQQFIDLLHRASHAVGLS